MAARFEAPEIDHMVDAHAGRHSMERESMGREAEAVVRLPWRIQAVHAVDLAGEMLADIELSVNGDSVSVRLKPWQICMIRLHPNSRRELERMSLVREMDKHDLSRTVIMDGGATR